MRDELIRDMEAMEQGMERTADRCDIWQDRLIYAMCKVIRDILLWILRRDKHETEN